MQEGSLKRGLKQRHMTMFSIGVSLASVCFWDAGQQFILTDRLRFSHMVFIMRMLAKWPVFIRQAGHSPLTPKRGLDVGRVYCFLGRTLFRLDECQVPVLFMAGSLFCQILLTSLVAFAVVFCVQKGNRGLSAVKG